jgi:2-phospho-L-lactate guanylyltransferase
MRTRPWVVLPVRGEASGKSRLGPLLDRVERMRLNRMLFHHTLQAIAEWQGTLARCIVVTPCARTGVAARRAGAIWLPERQPRRGLNRAVNLAVAHAVRHGARVLLVLHGDLPEVSPAALQALSRAAAGARVTIAPDRTRTGTNALLLATCARFDFAYGRDSFALHAGNARKRGWMLAVYRDPRLAFDLDTPADLTAWRSRSAPKRGKRG